MTLEWWLKISYSVQLSLGCLLFSLPLRKKKGFVVRFLVCTSCFLLLYFYLAQLVSKHEALPILLLYWGSYIVATVLLMYGLVDYTWADNTYFALIVCAIQHIAFNLFLICRYLTNLYWVSILLFLAVYGLTYLYSSKTIAAKRHFEVRAEAIIPMATILLIVWVLSVADLTGVTSLGTNAPQKLVYHLLDSLCCVYVLWVQISHQEKLNLQNELSGINYAWLNQINQYQVTRETIDNINRKCHDLKYQIKALRHITGEAEKSAFFDEIEREIMIFDSAVQTGNKALDIVLMEKGMFCNNHGIQWSCMAEGSLLDFIQLEDIYAMFGNALDNAFTEVLTLDDPQRRIITIKILQQNELVMIQIQNYFNTQLHFEAGLPITTKLNKQNHGFGMKCIQYTAEKYNGAMTVSAENSIFNLQILIPLHPH